MPEISRFFGLVVYIYHNDHPPPHFHVRYGSQKARITIDSPRLLDGRLSPRVLGLAVEWAVLHHDELAADWALARQQKPLRPIAPLE